ncbi:hypothetical protein B0H67DRAFT_221609 [Lasiosphaeris hirsuta]|uniref:Rhodopsin domain-containing protein n=1 Tax=Lasiosphaeris hirsuta TaxID=260670 RepID=A0AA40DV92_9PEZI|nr:hypothetical protein B0H67DRAFT_221609 [Lasiosphaeris hirsuta]
MSAEEANRFIREVWGLQGAAYLVVGLRYSSRIHTLGWSKLAWDDTLMLLATLVYTAESVMAYLVVAYWRGLANNAMTDEQRAALDPNSEEHLLRVNGSKTHVAGLLLYTTLLWLLKGCWTVYYARLTDGVHKMRLMIKGAYIIIPLTYAACLLVAFCKCIPFNRQWQIYPFPGSKFPLPIPRDSGQQPSDSCEPAISTIQTVFVMVMNTITDFYLMAIPLPMVWKSSLPPRKKLVLLIMFSGGLLEMAFGILRCTSILTLGDIDPAQSGYWSVRESFVSVVLTNMPMVYPLVKRFFERGLSSISGSHSATQAESTHGYRLGSHSGRKANQTHNSKHPLSIPNETCWGSEENIVENSNADAKTTGTTTSSGDESPAQLPLQGKKTAVVHSERQISAGPPSPTYHSGGRDVERGQQGRGIVVTHEYTVTEQHSQARDRKGGGEY